MDIHYEGPTTFTATDSDPRPFTLTIEPSVDLPAGTEISAVLGGSYRSVTPDWILEETSVDGRGKITVEHDIPADFKAKYHCRLPDVNRNPPKQYRLTTIRIDAPIEAGSRITLAFRGKLSEHTGIEPKLSVWYRLPGGRAFKRGGSAILLENRGGEPVRLEIRARPEPSDDGSHRLVVFETDDCTNPASGHEATITLKTTGNGRVRNLPDTIGITPSDDGRYVVDNLSVHGEGPVRIIATDDDRNLTATSVALFPEPIADWGHYVGGIHFHTEFSHDGDRHIRDAYEYARDYLQLDVVAATDHTPGKRAWKETVAVNEMFDDGGEFATIPAWEWSASEGHANIYLRSSNVEAGPDISDPMEAPSFGHFDVDFGDGASGTPEGVDWPDGVVLVPHHSNARDGMGGKYWREWDWSVQNDRIRSVEVVQGRGNFEADAIDEEWDIRCEGAGSSVQDALEENYRLGFVAGTDNHQGFPTIRSADGPVGMTCFLAKDRTREEIWNALDDRRTYATSGVPIRCHYTVNGHLLGSEASLEDADVSFSAELYGTAPIEQVEIISDREVVWSAEPSAYDVILRNEGLPAPTEDSAYYYLRLRQEDGHRAWVSPVWLDR